MEVFVINLFVLGVKTRQILLIFLFCFVRLFVVIWTRLLWVPFPRRNIFFFIFFSYAVVTSQSGASISAINTQYLEFCITWTTKCLNSRFPLFTVKNCILNYRYLLVSLNRRWATIFCYLKILIINEQSINRRGLQVENEVFYFF